MNVPYVVGIHAHNIAAEMSLLLRQEGVLPVLLCGRNAHVTSMIVHQVYKVHSMQVNALYSLLCGTARVDHIGQGEGSNRLSAMFVVSDAGRALHLIVTGMESHALPMALVRWET